MRLLVFGGTVFLSREVAAEAVRRGHEVTCLARGASGAVPEGARLVEADRTRPLPALGAAYDAVVDVARLPSWVRSAVAALPDAHWVFVSTINVYPDTTTRGATPATLSLHEPVDEDVDLAEDPEAYGPMKVACEQLVTAGAASSTVVRPGLIVGPGDPSGRFSYWPRRLSRVGEAPEVLAPGDPEDVVQVIDVRDLARWLVDLAESRHAGSFDGVGPATPMAELLAAVAEGVGAAPSWTWVDQEFLTGREVAPWAGPGSLPLWLPRPEYDGMMSHDVQPSLDAGLTVRPVADTARATLAWLDADPGAPVGGIDLAREQELLAEVRAERQLGERTT